MAQPTMAPFVSQQLIQHLVTSNPSPAYIQRVAQVFRTTAAYGDMKSVITAILTDPEARAGDDPSAAPERRASATCGSRFSSWPTCCAA